MQFICWSNKVSYYYEFPLIAIAHRIMRKFLQKLTYDVWDLIVRRDQIFFYLRKKSINARKIVPGYGTWTPSTSNSNGTQYETLSSVIISSLICLFLHTLSLRTITNNVFIIKLQAISHNNDGKKGTHVRLPSFLTFLMSSNFCVFFSFIYTTLKCFAFEKNHKGGLIA